MRELKSKDISFQKSGCLFVAYILAELHISYISFTISSQPLSPTDEKRKRFSSHRIFKPTAIEYFLNVQMTDYLDNFDLVDRAAIDLYSALKRCLKMFRFYGSHVSCSRFLTGTITRTSHASVSVFLGQH